MQEGSLGSLLECFPEGVAFRLVLEAQGQVLGMAVTVTPALTQALAEPLGKDHPVLLRNQLTNAEGLGHLEFGILGLAEGHSGHGADGPAEGLGAHLPGARVEPVGWQGLALGQAQVQIPERVPAPVEGSPPQALLGLPIVELNCCGHELSVRAGRGCPGWIGYRRAEAADQSLVDHKALSCRQLVDGNEHPLEHLGRGIGLDALCQCFSVGVEVGPPGKAVTTPICQRRLDATGCSQLGGRRCIPAGPTQDRGGIYGWTVQRLER